MANPKTAKKFTTAAKPRRGSPANSGKALDVVRSVADLPDLKTIHNGEKVPGTFSAAEMEGRLRKLRRHMAAEGIDHVLFTSYHNINYYSDFLYCLFGRLFGLVVTQRKSTTISANIDAGQPWRRTSGTISFSPTGDATTISAPCRS